MGSYKKIRLSHEMGLIDTPPFRFLSRPECNWKRKIIIKKNQTVFHIIDVFDIRLESGYLNCNHSFR